MLATLLRGLVWFFLWKRQQGIIQWFARQSIKAQTIFIQNKPEIEAAFMATARHTLGVLGQLRRAAIFTVIGVIAGAFVGQIGKDSGNEMLQGMAVLLFVGPFAYSLVRIFLVGIQLEVANKGLAIILAAIIHGEQMAAYVAGKVLGFPVPALVSPTVQNVLDTVDGLVRKFWAIVCGVSAFLVAIPIFVFGGSMGLMGHVLLIFIACIGLVTYSLWTSKESLFKKVAMPIFVGCMAILVIKANWQPAMEYCFPLTMKKAAVERVLIDNENAHDKKLLGAVVYNDVVEIRKLGLKEKPTKCDQERRYALMKRATVNVKGEVALVIVPECKPVVEKPKTKEDIAAEAAAEAPKAERRAAATRVMAGKPQGEKKEVKADPAKNIAASPARKSDREILDGVYTNAVEIRNLEGSPKQVTLCQERLVALHQRVDAYVEGKKYQTIPVPECKKPAPVTDASGQLVQPKPKAQAAAKPGSVEDMLASMKKRQKEVASLLKTQ